MSEQEFVDPSALLYSVPTIEDRLPGVLPSRDPNAFTIHEDDWRQVEVVSHALRPAVDAELIDIVAVRAERKGPGFPRCHVRTRIPEPIPAGTISRAAVRDALEGLIEVKLQIDGSQSGLVEGGFAFPDGEGGAIYGRAIGEAVTELCLQGLPCRVRPGTLHSSRGGNITADP